MWGLNGPNTGRVLLQFDAGPGPGWVGMVLFVVLRGGRRFAAHVLLIPTGHHDCVGTPVRSLPHGHSGKAKRVHAMGNEGT